MGLLFFALLLDWFIGDPDALWRRVPHPVVVIGNLISRIDKARQTAGWESFFGNRQRSDFIAGVGLLILLALLCVLFAWTLSLLPTALSWLAELAIVAVLIAQKSLRDHVNAVRVALVNFGLEAGRKAVAMIVGREVSRLDRSGVSRAAIESLAENFSDGVVAPVFWYAVAGLPGIVFYKAVNTADSMIGHRTESLEWFGKPAAKLDDWMNWPPARLSALLIALAGFASGGAAQVRSAIEQARIDAPLHRSPNAGWPEAAMASVLGLALGGPRAYADGEVAAPVINPQGRAEADAADISAALDVFRLACFIEIGLVGLLFVLF